MKKTLNKNRFLSGLVPAFLLPFLGYLVVMIVMGHKPFGSSSILYSDMYHQYYPFFVEFRNTLRSGGSLQYNWSVGMGNDYLPLIAYYLASPLNLFSALLPESWLLGYFSLLVPIKLGLAGLFFSIMLRKLFGGDGIYANLFAGFYGLCAWALGYQWNIMWLDTFALLPLVFLGEIYLLRDKKFLLFSISLFFSVVCNYYIGLFVCIFVALIFFCYEISCWKGVRRFFADLGRIALFSFLTLGLTAFLEIPAFLGLQNTYSSVNKFPTTFSMNIAKKNTFSGLLDAMRQVLGNAAGGRPTFKEGLPNIYCGVLTGILGFQFFFSKEIRLREKILSAFLLLFFILSFIIRQLDYIWHGFHFTNMIPYRFSFLYSFVLLIMAYRAFLLQDKARPAQLVVSAVLFLGLCAMSDKRFNQNFLIFNVGFLVIYTGFLLLRRDRKAAAKSDGGKSLRVWSLALAGTMIGELACSLVFFGAGFGGTSVKNYPRGTQDTAYLLQEMKQREGDDGFYRTEFTHSQALNDGALNNVNGVTLFSSAANVNMTNFMGALGCGARPNYNRYLYEVSSPAANAFFNLKYILEREGQPLDDTYWDTVDTRGVVKLAENNAYLPLGFMTELSLANLDVTAPNAGSLSFQNDLYRLATGNAEPIYTLVDSLHVDSNGIEITTSTSSPGYCGYSSAVGGDQVIYTFLAPTDGVLCIDVFGSKKDKFKVYHNDAEILSETLGLRQIFALDHGQAGDVYRIIFDLIDGDSGKLELAAGVLDEDTFRKDLAVLGDETMELTEFTDTKITGTVTASKTGLLYTSIPYDSNWSAYVDGEEAEITPVGNAMLAVKLESGTHTVQFRFQNQGYRLGLKISLACLFILTAFYLVEYRPWDHKKVEKS